MKKVAIILSGCGVYDGSEIHETVLTQLALARHGAEVTCAAPNMKQAHVFDHYAGQVSDEESRNVLTESARLARGEIIEIESLDIKAQDAIIFPGGFGAAKNLCNYAFEGSSYSTQPIIEALIRKAHEMGKILGFICISPAVAAATLGSEQIEITIGNDLETAGALQSKGAHHINCASDDIVVDSQNRIVSTPAYMLAQNLLEVEVGINKLVDKVLEMAE
ncbi:MAG: isoprenoid biosynthesis glyoxalase ElbB [Coraliomargaritaceae bacterium]